MQKNELKINNFIIRVINPEVVTITEILDNGVQIKDSNNKHSLSVIPFNWIKPVELNSSWLEKFGFKLLEKNAGYKIWQFWSKDVGIFQIMELGAERGFRVWTGSSTIGTVFCSVHEFQNIFYGFTLQEATIIKNINS